MGDKAYSVRAPAYYDDVFSPAKVRNEVEYLSYYLKNRRAAEEHKKTLEPGKKTAVKKPCNCSHNTTNNYFFNFSI